MLRLNSQVGKARPQMVIPSNNKQQMVVLPHPQHHHLKTARTTRNKHKQPVCSVHQQLSWNHWTKLTVALEAPRCWIPSSARIKSDQKASKNPDVKTKRTKNMETHPPSKTILFSERRCGGNIDHLRSWPKLFLDVMFLLDLLAELRLDQSIELIVLFGGRV